MAAVHRQLPEQAVSLDVPRTRRRAAFARAVGLRQVRTGVRISSGADGRRHRDSELQLRLLRAAHVGRRRAHVGHQPASAERFPVSVRYAKFEVSPPASHGSWDAGYFGTDRVGLCQPVFNYPSVSVGGCGNSQMGPEHRYQLKDDFAYQLPNWMGTHQLKFGGDFSYVPFQEDSLGSPLGSWTFPSICRTTRTTRRPFRRSTRSRCPSTPTFRASTSGCTSRTTGNRPAG